MLHPSLPVQHSFSESSTDYGIVGFRQSGTDNLFLHTPAWAVDVGREQHAAIGRGAHLTKCQCFPQVTFTSHGSAQCTLRRSSGFELVVFHLHGALVHFVGRSHLDHAHTRGHRPVQVSVLVLVHRVLVGAARALRVCVCVCLRWGFLMKTSPKRSPVVCSRDLERCVFVFVGYSTALLFFCDMPKSDFLLL